MKEQEDYDVDEINIENRVCIMNEVKNVKKVASLVLMNEN